jgi:hypothetical protein
MNGSTFDAIEGGGFTIASQEANLPFEPTNADDFDF